MRTLRPRARVTSALAVFAMVAALVPLIAVPAVADGHLDPDLEPTQINFTLEGCRGEDFPDGYPLEALDFLCDQDYPEPGDTVDAYTTGNEGKTWNELDLVPKRLTAVNGDGDQTYELIIAADHEKDGTIGYDLITVPVLNTDLSSGTCDLVAGDEVIADIGVGGADTSIYRLLTITQSAGSVCVWDWQQRLAGPNLASLYSGSSLQTNLDAIGIGQKRVSIPTGEISPQALSKDMSATQDADFMWNLTKGATPAEYDFGCTCLEGNEDPSTEVTVRINWEKVEVAGDLTIMTNIYATNPSKRTITYDVSDEIFDALNASQGTAGPVSVDVPPNIAGYLVATFEFGISDGVDHLGETWSNTATAELFDKIFPDISLGELEASSDAVVQAGTQTNATAVITDVESIFDSGGVLSYSVDAVDGATGAFQGGYVLGDVTQDDVTWVSDAQDADGFVEFTKTVYLDGPAIVTDGKLSDVASLEASDGFEAVTDPAMTTFTSDAEVALTINKTITGGVLGVGQSETFLFDVYEVDTNDLVAGDIEVTITGPATSGSATVEGLEPGVEYRVEEQDIDFWTEGADAFITIDLPDCEGSVLFNNTFAPELEVAKTAEASYTERHDWDVLKTVDPGVEVLMGFPGDELPWTWTVEVFETVVDQDFLVEGQIDVTNPMPYDVEVTVTDELEFGTVADVDCDVFGGNVLVVAAMTTESCTYTASPPDASATLNTAIATTFFIPFPATAPVDFVKNVENDSATVSDDEIGLMDELVVGPDEFTGDDSHICSDDRADYGDDWMYMADVSNTAILTDAEGMEYDSTATTDYKCTTGFVDIFKTTNGQVDSTKDIRFDLYSGTTVLETVSTLDVDDGLLEFQTALVPGDSYTICESPVPAGFTFEIDVNGSNVLTYAGPPGAENPTGEIQCFDFTAEEKATLTFAVNNSFPGGAPRTPGYWKNWNTCTGGNQAETAEKLGGTAEGVFLLDDLLPQTVGDLTVDTCEVGVSILDSRDIVTGKKQGNDAAYTLARSYLAALLNQDAGACDPDGVTFDVAGVGDGLTFQEVLNTAQALLSGVFFDGTGKYLTPNDKSQNRVIALALYGIIDDYNNGEICTGDFSH